MKKKTNFNIKLENVRRCLKSEKIERAGAMAEVALFGAATAMLLGSGACGLIKDAQAKKMATSTTVVETPADLTLDMVNDLTNN